MNAKARWLALIGLACLGSGCGAQVPTCASGEVLTGNGKVLSCVPAISIPTCGADELLTVKETRLVCVKPIPTCTQGQVLTGGAAGAACLSLSPLPQCMPGHVLTRQGVDQVTCVALPPGAPVCAANEVLTSTVAGLACEALPESPPACASGTVLTTIAGRFACVSLPAPPPSCSSTEVLTYSASGYGCVVAPSDAPLCSANQALTRTASGFSCMSVLPPAPVCASGEVLTSAASGLSCVALLAVPSCGTNDVLSTSGGQLVCVKSGPDMTFIGPTIVAEGATGLHAAVAEPDTGTSYHWTISNGTITSSNTAREITYTAGAVGPLFLVAYVYDAAGNFRGKAYRVEVVPGPNAEVFIGGPRSLLGSGDAVVSPGTTGIPVSVPVQPGATVSWSVTGGTLRATSKAEVRLLDVSTQGATVTATVTNSGVSATGTASVTLLSNVPQTWSAPLFAHREHTATVLPSGRVVLAGGLDATGVVQWLEVFDPASESYAQVPLVAPRALHQAAVLAPTSSAPGGRVLLVGGYGPSFVAQSSVEVFDPRTMRSTAVSGLSSGRFAFGLAKEVSGTVLVCGGATTNFASNLSSCERFDPDANGWSAAPSMLSPRRYLSLLTTPEGVLAMGWTAGVELLGTTGWSTAGNLGTPRYVAQPALLPDGRVLLMGGNAGASGARLSSTELFDHGSWSAGPSMLAPHADFGMTQLRDGRIVVVGGNGALTAVELFTPAAAAASPAGIWSSLATLSPVAFNTVSELPDGRLFVFGGANQPFAVLLPRP